MLRSLCGRYGSNYFALVLVVGLRTAPFYGITHIVEYQDRDGRHALPLFGTKSFVEWLPRLGEFIQIGRSLSQRFRASLQKGDGVTIAHDFKRTFVGPFTHCFCDFCKTGFPILRPATNSTLYSRPVF